MIKKNHLELFDKIYNENYKLIYQLSQKLVPVGDDASDVAQEVFIKLYQNLEKGMTIEYPRSWLYKVTVNKCIDFEKRRQKHTKIESARYLKVEDNLLEMNEKQAVVRLALSKLKKDESVLAILYSEGLSYKEIAEITGIRFSSVGKTLSRTLVKLGDELKKLHYELY